MCLGKGFDKYFKKKILEPITWHEKNKAPKSYTYMAENSKDHGKASQRSDGEEG